MLSFYLTSKLFLGLLITGGQNADYDGLTPEVWLPGEQSCRLPSLPSLPGFNRRYWHTQSSYTVCGGGFPASSACHTFSGEWEESHSLDMGRFEHLSWQSPAGTLLMGGFSSGTSTELLSNTSNTTTPGFDLPYRTS